MIVSVTSGVVRIMGVWVRRADAGLARGAARNAAVSMADHHAQRLEAARALHELHSVLPVEPPSGTATDAPDERSTQVG